MAKIIPRRQVGRRSLDRTLIRIEGPVEGESTHRLTAPRDVVVQGEFNAPTRVQVLAGLGRYKTVLDVTHEGFGTLLTGTKNKRLTITVTGTATGFVEVL